MFFGFITGGLARLAVPGPDPMPIWLTVAIGLAGSAAGGGIAIAIWGRGTQAIGLLSFLGAVLLVVAYRRFVQKRAAHRPDALKFPERGIGIDKLQGAAQQDGGPDAAGAGQAGRTPRAQPTSNLRKLSDLHEAGILTDEEYEAKKALLQDQRLDVCSQSRRESNGHALDMVHHRRRDRGRARPALPSGL